MNIFNFDDGIFRGEAPQGLVDLLRLQQKTRTWLHLESGVQRFLPGSWAYAAQDWQVRLQCEYLYMPMWNFSFPHQGALDWCALTIELERSKHGIYVCCKHGKDRTGIVLAYWRVKHCGWTPERAWEEAQTYGMHKFYILLGWEQKFLDIWKTK